MTPRRVNRLLPFLAMGIGILIVTACSPSMPRSPLSPAARTDRLSEAEQIAGEIMAYLIEVVLGRAGAPDKRDAWATRGRDLPLDFDMVSRRMYGPVPLRAELMVLDTNILGLSRVLYHYDPRLNLFKGTRDHDSLYPCAELMAIRLLLLRKLHRNERVSIAGLLRNSDRFAPGSRDASAAELAAMQLTATEFRFLKAIFQSEPAFLRYLRHPFIISTFRKIGVAEPDALTLSADLAATYSRFSCEPDRKKKAPPATIAIVPAMNAMFEAAPATGRIRPSDDYLKLQEQLRSDIVRRIPAGHHGPSTAQKLAFFTPDRPVTLTPENADRVIGQLCPNADFTVILLGKNVYRAMHIDPHADISPHKQRIYLDVDDVRYRQIDDDIDTIVSAILPAITAAAAAHPAS
ncbi:hypothetical protein DSCA_22450 [Desulfosarcina alkanivorans]|uniref:Lipoprotein n=1 Tax=Desulfosarcina alkanivorans TaxID=571177 RepID=A0A5K7YIV0_9BACT|nr:hypothetical protein [Desulfosarcina alkanivorans]BBO68315.1 hypothetical protein DSCA_22450 [Desulfosarcina alkanivorans]